MFDYTGLTWRDTERGASHCLPGSAQGVGEDAGEDDRSGQVQQHHEEEDSCLGKGHRSEGEPEQDGRVCITSCTYIIEPEPRMF